MDIVLHRTGQVLLWSGVGLVFFVILWAATILTSHLLDISPS